MSAFWSKGTQHTKPPSSASTPYVAQGMPPLEWNGKIVSWFEFWPTWLMYLPVVGYWFWLSIRFRSLTLPLLANPKVPSGGMVGFSKSSLLAQANSSSTESILSWIKISSEGQPTEQLPTIKRDLHRLGWDYPVVGKPDLGCRGAGVKLLKNSQELRDYLESYPKGTDFILQQLSRWEPEVGIFYVRYPHEECGRIISMAFKYSPYVVGDGRKTLSELLDADPRAKNLRKLYDERHQAQLQRVLKRGEAFKLVFSASHCRGAIFRDGRDYITEALETKVDTILKGLPDFYYGRLDVKFEDLEALQRGETLEIVEINGVSSESLHIWDSNQSLWSALATLLSQYRILFTIGDQNRKKGFKAMSLRALWQAWRKEARLVRQYPSTD